ncbi:hypothetical protein MITS9509_00943 [Synechococcus sp. MIT S9509]|uniref:hypothetical protein n=1 Tax=Synechococcus sp. MIT S9509 TaxID=1801630 RepID=UPI0007BB2EE5|nr:hypothetical protein [Synechococcus sp. MIT S9509]KZR93067.1 hypothetical protein MITS9509_00943 [Synechococcus sp. MIT S9509]
MGIRIRLFARSLLPLLLLLQACDGTPFGQRLSESFDSQAGEVSPEVTQAEPDDNDPEDKDPADNFADSRVVTDKNEDQAKVNDNDNDNKQPKARVSEAEDSTERPEVKPTPERTLPYRIMIRLSAADPAAPAEGVTEALRRAGIGFEVETIEKVPVSDLNQPSQLQPKPAS